MRITPETLYTKSFERNERYFRASDIEAIEHASEKYYGPICDLAFADYWAIANGDKDALFAVLGDMSRPTIFQTFWVRAFRKYTETFSDALKRFSIPQTLQEKTAADSCAPVGFAEGILIFARSYFGLHSFREAERITMGEILIAKKAAYNDAIFRKKLSALQIAGLKNR